MKKMSSKQISEILSKVAQSTTPAEFLKTFSEAECGISFDKSRGSIIKFIMLLMNDSTEALSQEKKNELTELVGLWVDFKLKEAEINSSSEKAKAKTKAEADELLTKIHSHKFFTKENAPVAKKNKNEKTTSSTSENDTKPVVSKGDTEEDSAKNPHTSTTPVSEPKVIRHRKHGKCNKCPNGRVRIVTVPAKPKTTTSDSEIKEVAPSTDDNIIGALSGKGKGKEKVKPTVTTTPKKVSTEVKPSEENKLAKTNAILKVAVCLLGVFLVVGIVLTIVNPFSQNKAMSQTAEPSGYGRLVYSDTLIELDESMNIRIDTAAQSDVKFELDDLELVQWRETTDKKGRQIIYYEMSGEDSSRICISCPAGRKYAVANVLNGTTIEIRDGIARVVQGNMEYLFQNNDTKK